MPGSFVECPQVVGKTIQNLKLYPDSPDGSEAVIEFSDGTAFSCCITQKPAMKAMLYRPGNGAPHVICDYDT